MIGHSAQHLQLREKRVGNENLLIMSELIKKKDKTRELLLELTPEQLSDYYNHVIDFNVFIEEVKQVMIKNILNKEDKGIEELQHQNTITQFIVWSTKEK